MHQDRRIDLELLELGVLLHQNLFLVLHLAVLRDGGIVLQLSSDSHVVGVLVGVVEGPGHLAVIVLIGGGEGGIIRQTWPELLWKLGRRHFERRLPSPPLKGGTLPRAGLGSWQGKLCLPVFEPKWRKVQMR